MQQVKIVSTPTKITQYPNDTGSPVFGCVTYSSPNFNIPCHGLAVPQALDELRNLKSVASILNIVTTELSNEIITYIYYNLKNK